VLAGGVAGVVVLVREGRSARRKAISYGPFLAFGAIAVMLLHAP
jgi:prepilin signal peptidase PulO-like enzyme (type II secretory pathway)